MGHSPLLQHPKAFFTERLISANVWGISCRFQQLSPSEGQVSHVLLTRSPLSPHPKTRFSFDLHVLGTPPAFILSQDQTLHIEVLLRASIDARYPLRIFGRSHLLASCHSAVVKVPLQLKAGQGNKNAVCIVTSGGGISTLKTSMLSALPKRPPSLPLVF
jgi:hypothetical protein